MYEYVPSRLGDGFGMSDKMEYSGYPFSQHLTILDDSYDASSGQSDEETEEYCYQDLTPVGINLCLQRSVSFMMLSF
ncbi:hypothetical protein PHLCEN_2v10759 [Hermanssonia centrifuga]|uniref:Uncharacterized protein n=1 Tax=Hermanssonia centrifuga TaxID=98765 RepID=A0A2R6NM49_9APHY|nr:hypothetical protein PHLCEN_2v10759 [Hermanssonia centrifuga]